MSAPAGSAALVVEDDNLMAAVIKALLVKQGWTVDVVGDGESGLKRLTEQPDRWRLAVVDLFLPHLSGLDLIRQVRARPELGATPIIVLSASAQEGDVVTALEIGADDFLTKPLRPSEFLARLKRVRRAA